MDFIKGLSLFIAGIISTLLVLFVIVPTDTTENLSPQERSYKSCLESVYSGYGANKITMDSDKATPEDRLSMKKYCLCTSDAKRVNKLLTKKLENFAKKHDGKKPSAIEYDVILTELELEINTICNNESR